MKERIQKVLANAGVDSRRNIEAMVREGRVAVNGRVKTEPPILIDPEKDKVEVDGELVKLGTPMVARRYYFILNKPKGVYSTNVAQGVQVRAIDLLPRNLPARVYPVGRLDAESKGLLLLTNDGELTNQLTHPRYGVAKTYRAVVDGYVGPEVLEQVQKGVWLADKSGEGFRTGKSRIRIVRHSREQSTLEITFREGQNLQIRRVLAKLGHKVRDLTRTRMGPLTLEGIPVGHFRPLTGKEVKELRRSAQGQGKGVRAAGGGAKRGVAEGDGE
jgi:23S rRNA pseudouridine2605 synthase